MKKLIFYLIPFSACLLLLAACGSKKQQDTSKETQQQTAQPETKPVTPTANSFIIKGRDVKGTIVIDTSESQNGPVVADSDTTAIEDKNIEKFRLQATKWNHEAIGIIPVTESYNDLEKTVEDMIKTDGGSFDVVEKGTNCLFYHCKVKVYDSKDLYGFIVYVKGKNKAYELYCDGNYMSPNPGTAVGFIEEKDDAMKVYKLAQTFQPNN